MRYRDPIYGDTTIEEPVLCELLDSAALNRLRGVYQGGITALLGIAPDFSRFEHSLGVCLLLRRLGATLEEQIAGLLHDVSHTAFSHVVDFLYGQHDQTYHERIYPEMLAASDVPRILSRHGYDWRSFLHGAKYPLLEQPLPHLCADRLDYCFRDAVPLGLATRPTVAWLAEHLAVHDGRIVVRDRSAARWLADTYMQADDRCWSDLREVSLYFLTADALRAGLDAGCIVEHDLLGTDQALWRKLNNCAPPDVARRLAPITVDTRFVLDPDAPDFVLTPKIRAIDPDVLDGSQVRPLSALDPGFAAALGAYLARKRPPWPVRMVVDVVA